MNLLRSVYLLSVLSHQYGGVNGQPPNPDTFLGVPLQIVPSSIEFDGNLPSSPDDACGLTCRGPPQYPYGLLACLRTAFEEEAGGVGVMPRVTGVMPRVNISDSGDSELPKVVFGPSTVADNSEFNLDEYNKARYAFLGARLPAAILYAETTADVEKGVNCARVNGFKVSPRGRGHDASALSTMDGALVIDMQLNCKMENFEADKTVSGDHILPGSKYIGKMRVPSGCTNAVFLAAVHNEFKEASGMNVIGTCPSVGVTGFVLNGGIGDLSPYMGLGSDVIDEFEMVLYNGTTITASVTENEDIFWASKGGTGGIGVITNFVARILENPSPTKKFTRFELNFAQFTDLEDKEQLEIQVDIQMKLQEFLYDNPDAAKLGGTSDWNPNFFGLKGIFLGSLSEFVDIVSNAGLLDERFMQSNSLNSGLSRVTRDGLDIVCSGADCREEFGEKFAEFGIVLNEYGTQAEAQAEAICGITLTTSLGFVFAALSFGETPGTGAVCADLGIPASNCNELGFIQKDLCFTKVVIDAVLEAASKPQSFLNRKGPPFTNRRTFEEASGWPTNTMAVGIPNIARGAGTGGYMLPKLQRDTFRELLRDTTQGFECGHFAHGAPLAVDPDSDGYPHRNAAYLIKEMSRQPQWSNILLKDQAFNGDPNKLQIYANYNPSWNIPNYERHVYWDKAEELSRIRTVHDPLGGFDSPRYPQRQRVPMSSTGTAASVLLPVASSVVFALVSVVF